MGTSASLRSRQRAVQLLTAIGIIFACYRTGFYSSERTTTIHHPSVPAEFRVDVNHALPHELQLLPGIGQKMSENIVAYRAQHGPFKSIQELSHIKGIGPKRMEQIAGFLELRE